MSIDKFIIYSFCIFLMTRGAFDIAKPFLVSEFIKNETIGLLYFMVYAIVIGVFVVNFGFILYGRLP